MASFSDNFLLEFPSVRSHHNEPICLVNYSDKSLTPAQKNVVVDEMHISGISHRNMAKYL